MRMRITRTVTALVALGIIGAGGFLAFRLAAEEQKEGATKPGAEQQTSLKKGLLEAARKVYEFEAVRFRNREGSSSELYLWSRRWLEAQVDLSEAKGERIDAYRDHFERMKTLEKSTKAFAISGQGREADAVGARYFRIQAELWLEQAKVK